MITLTGQDGTSAGLPTAAPAPGAASVARVVGGTPVPGGVLARERGLPGEPRLTLSWALLAAVAGGLILTAAFPPAGAWPLAPLGRILASRIGRSPLPLPALVPLMPLQFVHEDDLGQALLRCVLGAGPPGAYNIAADGILSTADVAREFGLIPLPLPGGPARLAARALSALPFLPPAAQWVEAASHPAIMDTAKAKRDLGWTPRFTALEALRDTLRPDQARR